MYREEREISHQWKTQFDEKSKGWLFIFFLIEASVKIAATASALARFPCHRVMKSSLSRVKTESSLSRVKTESHCSDNKNDNDHDAKRTHCIGWIPHAKYAHAHSTNRMCSLCIVVIIVIAAVGPGRNTLSKDHSHSCSHHGQVSHALFETMA